MSKLPIYLIVFLISAFAATATYCYQETATLNTSCGGLASGTYVIVGGVFTTSGNLNDGNWGTYSQRDSGTATYLVNYTIPLYAYFNQPILQYKMGDGTAVETNWTVSTACWDYAKSIGRLRLGFKGEAVDSAYVFCYSDATTEVTIEATAISNARFYEEAMFWDLGNYSASIYDEDLPTTVIGGTINAVYSIFNTTNNQNIRNYSFTGSTYSVIPNINLTATEHFNLYIQDTTPNGFTHRFYLFNQSAQTSPLYLYNYNTTTGVSDAHLTIRDYTSNMAIPNILVVLQRFYPAQNVWLTVQEDLSDDYGTILFHIKEQSVDYRLLFYSQNTLLQQTNPLKFKCTSGLCELTYKLQLGGGITSYNITQNLSYSNITKLITYRWQDMQSQTHQVRFNVTKPSGTRTVTICSSYQSGAAGNVSCNMSAYQGTVLVLVSVDGNVFLGQYIELYKQKIGDLIGRNEGGLWAAFLVILIAGMAVISPVIGIILLVVILAGISMFGLFTPITTAFIILASLFAIYIGFRVKS